MVKDEKTFTEVVRPFPLLSCPNVLLLRQIKSTEILLNMAPVKKSAKVNLEYSTITFSFVFMKTFSGKFFADKTEFEKKNRCN